jgi:uncharacterized membrane protein
MDAFLINFEHTLKLLTQFLILAFELTGALILVHTIVNAVLRFLRLRFNQTSTDLRIRLGRGISFALMLYLSAEILRLVLIRNVMDLAIVGIIIVLHVIVTVLVAWEVTHSLHTVKEEHAMDDDTQPLKR